MPTQSPTWGGNFGQADHGNWLDAYQQTAAPSLGGYFNQDRQASPAQQPTGFAQGVTATANPKQQFYANMLQRQATQAAPQQPGQSTEWQEWMKQYQAAQEARMQELTDFLQQQREAAAPQVQPPVVEQKPKAASTAPSFFEFMEAFGHKFPVLQRAPYTSDNNDSYGGPNQMSLNQEYQKQLQAYKNSLHNPVLREMYATQYGVQPDFTNLSYLTEKSTGTPNAFNAWMYHTNPGLAEKTLRSTLGL